jgi:hypothetical protein
MSVYFYVHGKWIYQNPYYFLRGKSNLWNKKLFCCSLKYAVSFWVILFGCKKILVTAPSSASLAKFQVKESGKFNMKVAKCGSRRQAATVCEQYIIVKALPRQQQSRTGPCANCVRHTFKSAQSAAGNVPICHGLCHKKSKGWLWSCLELIDLTAFSSNAHECWRKKMAKEWMSRLRQHSLRVHARSHWMNLLGSQLGLVINTCLVPRPSSIS